MTGDNVTKKDWSDPLNFKEEGIVLDYKTAGVDIDAGNYFVEKIKPHVKSTYRPEVLGGLGGFNGMMRIPTGYESPILVSGTDGVGTKGMLSTLYGRDYDIGIDLVAMCVNDVITCGAEPLYFLDYVSCPKVDDNKKITELVAGIADGCRQSGCSLLGGETAEHPQRNAMTTEYDIAGFCTGVVEERKIIDGSSIKPSDRVIGLASNGVHANGFSLIRYLTSRLMLKVADHSELLSPTRIYAPVVKAILDEVEDVYGMAHITGGGIPENLPRCLPKGLRVDVDWNAWSVPEIFKTIQSAGNVDELEMRRVFNLGIGYCVVVPANRCELTMDVVRSKGIECWEIGEVYE